MSMPYLCTNKRRREEVRIHPTLNGIDFLEVLDKHAPADSPRQRTLLVRCLKALPDSLTRDNVRIEGGVRVRSVGVEWAGRAVDAHELWEADLLSQEEATLLLDQPEPDHLLVVRTDSEGDFSTYRLRLVRSPGLSEPPAGFDPVLSEVAFSFKVECPSDFDCRPMVRCPAEPAGPEPLIDYLAKDYASFRQLMLDRLSLLMPDWTERSPVDLGIALVELLAYAGDQLSYYQDAVATEAYLGTARRRVSLRRHARLLDYPMHEGCNARTWVHVRVSADEVTLPQGSQLLTSLPDQPARIVPGSADHGRAMAGQPTVLETLHDALLCQAHNELRFYTWSDERCCLPKGATRATLCDDPENRVRLRPGDVLLFEEVRGPKRGLPPEADPAHRHAVRLARVYPEAELTVEPAEGEEPRLRLELKVEDGEESLKIDPLTGQAVVEIEWLAEDALPFPLCLWEVDDPTTPEEGKQPVSVARGNIVLADHGRTVGPQAGETLEVPENGPWHPRLLGREITHRVPYDHTKAESQPAARALTQDPRAAVAAVVLREDNGVLWHARQDLLSSDRFADEFVVEVEEDGSARLRFGDNVLGRKPAGGSSLQPIYRVGSGRAGNIGAEAISHIVCADSAVVAVRNLLPAQGGTERESAEQVRLYAPQAFRTQERAVTIDDYVTVTQRHPEVQKAVATRRWTGSWHTVFITVDRRGGRPVDSHFEAQLRAFLERYRLAGHDIEIEPPVYVPLDIALRVMVNEGTYRSTVQWALLEAFSSQDLPDGRQGFFHPDRFTFGQPLYLSQVVSAAMEVAGVRWVEVTRFQRWGQLALGEREQGQLSVGRREIVCLDNDPNAPEKGKIEFIMEGGL